MTLENVKEIISNNREAINKLTGSYKQDFFYNFFNECIELIEKEDSSKITKDFKDNFNNAVFAFTDIIIKMKTTQDEKNLIQAIGELLYNISINYDIQDTRASLSALRILASTAKSLEEILFTTMFLFNKLNNCAFEEPTSNFLSRKYYTELSSFLENRKNHDEKYDV